MDLPTCPACKQSVLDDDVTECPFCGAPLKGGAAAPRSGPPQAPRPAPRKTAPPAKMAPAPAAPEPPAEPQRPAVKSPPARLANPAEDDPFAVDTSISEKAIPVSPKPAAGRNLEVKCPMCETVGYVSPKAAGQSVRCCNPACLVPIFTVPAPKKAEAPPPPPPKKSPLPWYLGIGAALLVAGGFAAWQFLGGSAPSRSEGFPPLEGVSTTFKPETTADKKPEAASESGKPAGAHSEGNAIATLTQELFRKLENTAVNAPANRKAYCRRMAALARIEAGDLQGARAQLDQLQKVSAQSAYEACLPTVLMAWRQFAVSEKDFSASLAEAVRLAGQLPPRGRYAIEAGIATAAILAAKGDLEASRKVLDTHQGQFELRPLASVSQIVQHEETFDFDAPLIGRSLGDWLAPSATGVTLILAAHARWEDARSWSVAMTDPLARAETALAWGEALARGTVAADPDASLLQPLSAAEGLPQTVKVRLLARLADVQRAAGNRSAADELLQQALPILHAEPVPPAISLGGAKAVLEIRLPDANALRLAALAAAEIGVLQARLEQPEAAWNSLELALRFLRGSAPGLGFTEQRVSQLEGAAADRIRGELKTSLQLKTDDQIRRAFAQYKNKCEDLHRAAINRFVWQAEVLEAAARAGLATQVWNEVQVAGARPDAGEREPFLGSAVPIVLGEQFRALGKADQERKVAEAARKDLSSVRPELKGRVVALEAAQAISAGNVDGALRKINESLSNAPQLHEWSYRLASRLVKAGKVADAFHFVRGLRDTVLREEALYFTAALGTRLGHLEDVRQATAGVSLTESAAANAGIVTGLAHPAPAK